MEAKEIDHDVQAFTEQERKRREELERAMKSHKKSLEKQIVDGKAPAKKTTMAEQEYAINKRLLEEIDYKKPSPIKKPFWNRKIS